MSTIPRRSARADGTPPQQHSVRDYRPITRPGARAPHAWLPDGRSTLDLYGRGFVLLRLGDDAPNEAALVSAFARRGVPLAVAAIPDPNIRELYERRLVLVRPDGHVAWRGDAMPEDPLAVVDCVRGAAPQQA
jgi:Aromatic-ring hydroxylase, C-terminal